MWLVEYVGFICTLNTKKTSALSHIVASQYVILLNRLHSLRRIFKDYTSEVFQEKYFICNSSRTYLPNCGRTQQAHLFWQELQFWTGFSYWLNGICMFKTIFPILSTMGWHKCKIVGRKVQGPNNRQNPQKRLLSLKMRHHRLPESWSAATSKEDEAKRLKTFLYPLCTCTSSLPLPFPWLCTVLPQGLGIGLLSVEMATPDDKGLLGPWLPNQAVTISVLSNLCTLPMAGGSAWFSPPHFGCSGDISIGKSSRRGCKVCVLLSMCHMTQSHGHSAQMSYLFLLFTSFISLLLWQLPLYQKMVTCKLLIVSAANN